jgi:hypothetical protein
MGELGDRKLDFGENPSEELTKQITKLTKSFENLNKAVQLEVLEKFSKAVDSIIAESETKKAVVDQTELRTPCSVVQLPRPDDAAVQMTRILQRDRENREIKDRLRRIRQQALIAAAEAEEDARVRDAAAEAEEDARVRDLIDGAETEVDYYRKTWFGTIMGRFRKFWFRPNKPTTPKPEIRPPAQTLRWVNPSTGRIEDRASLDNEFERLRSMMNELKNE